MSNIIDLNKYKEDKIAENYKTKTAGDFYNKIIKASALKSLKKSMDILVILGIREMTNRSLKRRRRGRSANKKGAAGGRRERV